MSENSPTEQVDTGSGSASADLPQNQSTEAADAGRQDSVSSGDTQQSTDQSQGNQPDNSQTTGDQGSTSTVDDGLAKFAKSQGVDDVSQLSERELKFLKTAHDNQKAFRKTAQDTALRDTAQDVNTVSEDDLKDVPVDERREIQRDAEIAQLRAAQRVSDFWSQNPDAREYETDMAKLIQTEKERRGPDAARYLASDLNRLYTLAKAERGSDDTERVRREERERLRREQEGSAEGGQAQNTHSSPTKVTREWLASEYDPSNEEHRQMVDQALQRGDLY